MASTDERARARSQARRLAAAALAALLLAASCTPGRAPDPAPAAEFDDDGATGAPPVVAVSHPLWSGRLTGDARAQRLRRFVAELEAADREERDLEPIYAAHLDALGVGPIITAVERAGTNCHPVLHDLGELIGKRTNDLELSFALCGDACTYSCIHGAVRGVLARTGGHASAPNRDGHAPPAPPAAALKAQATELCREDSRLVPDFFRGNCAHAVGHALAVLAPDAVQASADCRVFDAAAMQHYCHSGVFMELEDEIMHGLQAETMQRAERIKAGTQFCTTRLDWPSSCMRFLLGQARTLDEVKIVETECVGLNGAARRGCFNGLGFFSRGYLAKHPREIERFCATGSLIDRQVCIAGMFLLKKGHSLANALYPLCERMARAELAEVCRDQRARWYYQMDNPFFDLIFTGDAAPLGAALDRSAAAPARSDRS